MCSCRSQPNWDVRGHDSVNFPRAKPPPQFNHHHPFEVQNVQHHEAHCPQPGLGSCLCSHLPVHNEHPQTVSQYQLPCPARNFLTPGRQGHPSTSRHLLAGEFLHLLLWSKPSNTVLFSRGHKITVYPHVDTSLDGFDADHDAPVEESPPQHPHPRSRPSPPHTSTAAPHRPHLNLESIAEDHLDYILPRLDTTHLPMREWYPWCCLPSNKKNLGDQRAPLRPLHRAGTITGTPISGTNPVSTSSSPIVCCGGCRRWCNFSD